MIFNSYIFVLLFLPVTILGYYLIIYLKKYRLANLFLFIASLLFYGYANPLYLIFIIIHILVNYLFYKGIYLSSKKELQGNIKIILGFGITFNIVVLIYFKYCNFFIESTNTIIGADFALRNVILPLGISFITFQQIAFLIDTYRNEVPKYNLLDYALFVSYFPHIISGPIILHKDFFPQCK